MLNLAISRAYIQSFQEIILPPSAIIKVTSWTRNYLSNNTTTLVSTTSTHSDTIQRMANNVARIYARRVLELAAMSAATVVSKTKLEEAIDKPTEWSTIDLERQRRDFGQSISSLGKTKIERVWAAGTVHLLLILLFATMYDSYSTLIIMHPPRLIRKSNLQSHTASISVGNSHSNGLSCWSTIICSRICLAIFDMGH